VHEEELAQATGQVMAYFQTVSEKRLILDEEGIALVRDLITIFKDALGDAAPGIRALDGGQLEAWNSRYQSLMARMKPIEEGVEHIESDEAEIDDDEMFEQASGRVADVDSVREPPGETSGHDASLPEQETIEQSDDLRDKLARAMAAMESSAEEPPASDVEEKVLDETDEAEPPHELEDGQPLPMEDVPHYDPAEEVHVRDVVISDAEVGSAREYMALGKRKPQFTPKEDQAPASFIAEHSNEDSQRSRRESQDNFVKSPVQLEEVERLKRRLLELHEKQEMLSSKMSGILGDLKKAVRGDQKNRGRSSVGELDIEDLENLIFIGRKKG